MKLPLLLLIILYSFSSCRTTQEVVSISSGGVGSEVSKNPEDLLVSSETFAYHATSDGISITPSNVIRYIGYRDVRATRKAHEKDKAKLTRAQQREIDKREKEEHKKNRNLGKKKSRVARGERLSRSEKKLRRQQRKSANEHKKAERQKPSYATVDVAKYFYKRNIFNPVVSLLCIPMAIPTLGQSFKWMHPITRKEVQFSQACRGKGCTGRKNIVKTKILLEANIRVKRDEIRDNVVIIENLPESIVLKSFKIKKSVGSAFVSEVSHQELVKNGKTYHSFTIIPKQGSFKKTIQVRVLLDVWITPRETDLVALAETH